MPTSAPEPPCADTGFTVLELLVVLVLLAGAAALLANLAPRAPGWSSPAATAAAVATELRATRSDALRRGVVERIAIDVDARTLTTRAGARPIGGDAAVSLVVAREAAVGQGPAILFFPDGSSTGGTVVLTTAGGERRVSVHWLTGLVHVAP